jgi:dCTP deaminase
MGDVVQAELFPKPTEEQSLLFSASEGGETEHSTGILPSQLLREIIGSTREIGAIAPIEDYQIQPASIDLRLDNMAYRVKASFLPGPQHTVREKLDALSIHAFDISDGAVLERDCIYIIPLMESLNLRWRTSAAANPKSSTGRLDVFARVITDYGTQFDAIREG